MKLVDNSKKAKNNFEQGMFSSVMNEEEGRQWFRDFDETVRKDFQNGNKRPFDEAFIMFSDHRELMKMLFKKPSFYFRGEFYYHDYVFEFKGHLFLVGTAKDKGTSYEICENPDVPIKGVIYEFLTEFHKTILESIKFKSHSKEYLKTLSKEDAVDILSEILIRSEANGASKESWISYYNNWNKKSVIDTLTDTYSILKNDINKMKIINPLIRKKLNEKEISDI